MAGIAFGRRTLKLISSLTRSATTTTTRRFTTLPPSSTPWIRPTLPLSSTPWLRLPSDMNDMYFVIYDNFLNIVDKRLVKLDLVESYSIDHSKICVGSTRGSLAYLSESGKMYFVHPYTGGSRKYVLYNDQGFDVFDQNYGDPNPMFHSSTRCFTQVGDVLTVLCEDTHDHGDPIRNCYHKFFVNWPKIYDEWSRCPHLFHKDDPPIVYCDANETAYKLSRDIENRQWVEQWDMSDNHIKIKSMCKVGPSSSNKGLRALLPSNTDNSERWLRMGCNQDRHLVVTGDSGEADPVLYLVVRHHNRELGISQTRAVDVFRLDLVEEKMIYTTKLDDHAFFIGVGSDSFAISVDKCPELKPNSIYIADDLIVFDLKERSISPIVDMGDLSRTRLQAFWVPPPSQEQIEGAKRNAQYYTEMAEVPEF